VQWQCIDASGALVRRELIRHTVAMAPNDRSPARRDNRSSSRRGGGGNPGRGGVTVAREAHGRERTLIEHDRLPLAFACALDGLARHRAAGEPLDKVVAAIARERHLGPRERRATADLAFSWARHAIAVEKILQTAQKQEGGVAPRRRQLDLAAICLAGVAAGVDVDSRAVAGLPAFLIALVEDSAAAGVPLPVSLPPWLKKSLEARFSPEVIAALTRPARPDLAVDRRVMSVTDAAAALVAAGTTAVASPRCQTAIRITDGGLSLRKLSPALRRAVWPMDEGSQLVADAVGASPGDRVLDLCAGGGGKSRLLASTGAVVVAADIDAGRLHHSTPAGVTAIVADGTNSPFRPGSFDRVLVDAPCSGTGTLRRAPDLAMRLDERELPELAARQKALLTAALDLVRPGGRVVYATCSLLDIENDAVVNAVVNARTDVNRIGESRYLLPPDSDGFFIAVLERRA
jgi:16S rRNA (cytosine967-C5)-methyltransferase